MRIDDYYSQVNFVTGESSTAGMSAGDIILLEDATGTAGDKIL